MKNYEKYAEEIREYEGTKFCNDFVQPHVLKEISCDSIGCGRCRTLQMLWLLEEYKDPQELEVDWSKVEVDTPILVKFKEDKEWVKRHFAKYENGGVYAWKDSHTSWTSLHNDDVTFWSYAKLAEGEKECKEPKVDWSKVEVDTPILVRNTEDEEWRQKHFAKCDKYGFVYTWKSGRTSWTEEDLAVWNYAKLVESEERGKEPEIDWSKVKIDTPILVRDTEDGYWHKVHFAKYKDGEVYAWIGGTSWTTRDTYAWKYAKLAEDEGDK